MRQKILCVDFDGVIHSYTSGWKGPRSIPDPPVFGAIEWLRSLLRPESIYCMCDPAPFKVCIYSSRSKYIFAKRAMKKWLHFHGLEWDYIRELSFPTRKPAAFLQIDDRAVRFAGVFPTEKEMLSFKPWKESK